MTPGPIYCLHVHNVVGHRMFHCSSLHNIVTVDGIHIVGITTYITTDSGNIDRDPAIYMIAMGTCCLFFISWHIMALLTGVYLKSRRRQNSRLAASWCMRVCHVGYFAWIVALAAVSYVVWNGFTTFSGLTITYYVMLGFICCQYVMFLYCIIECCVDIFLCIDNTHSSPAPSS